MGHPLLFKRAPVAYVDGASSLSWNFIGFSRKPSYSASFLYLFSYYTISFYSPSISLIKQLIPQTPMPSPLQIPWIHLGWTLAPKDLPNPGIEPRSPTLQADALTSEPPEKPRERRKEHSNQA